MKLVNAMKFSVFFSKYNFQTFLARRTDYGAFKNHTLAILNLPLTTL
jgi:hypothetical protein